MGSAIKRFGVATVLLVLIFHEPLRQLIHLALNETLYSHVLLIPFVSLYLVYSDRHKLLKDAAPAARVAPLAVGLVIVGLAGYAWTSSLSGMLVAFLICFAGVGFQFLGRETMRACAFPLGFLIFIVPFPVALQTGIETFMQHSSAVTAEWMFRLSGMPVLREHLEIQLPAFRMAVAPECSGIRSSWVLFITSLMAGYLFLRTPWKRAALAFAVIPLAVLRNSFRIFVIGQLCVRIGPEMSETAIHRHGGPLFFALSLVPLILWLFILRKSEGKS